MDSENQKPVCWSNYGIITRKIRFSILQAYRPKFSSEALFTLCERRISIPHSHFKFLVPKCEVIKNDNRIMQQICLRSHCGILYSLLQHYLSVYESRTYASFPLDIFINENHTANKFLVYGFFSKLNFSTSYTTNWKSHYSKIKAVIISQLRTYFMCGGMFKRW